MYYILSVLILLQQVHFCETGECQIDNCQLCITAKECSVCNFGRFGKTCEHVCRGNYSTCSGCKDSYYLKIGIVLETVCFGCLEQEYFSSGECRHCPLACTSCVDETVCNECNDGYFGNDCSKVCPENCQKCSSQVLCTSCKDGWSGDVCQCSSNCLQVDKKDDWCSINGTCLKGCVNGKRGIGCTANCPKTENCLKCDQFNERCLQCSNGLYGSLSYCDKTCGHCKPNSNGYIECDVDTGECKDACVDGFFGHRCDQKCAKCLPDENRQVKCDINTGYCRNDCVNGFYGNRCDIKCKNCVFNNTNYVNCDTECKNVPCMDGFYGIYCDKECSRYCFDPSTHSNKCDKISGNCTFSCFHGWYGETCEKKCSTTCSIQSCNLLSGECNNGCITGWHGDTCREMCNSMCFNRSCDQQLGYCEYGCVSGSYGAMCQHKCSDTCEKGVCDRQTSHCSFGCEAGFEGAFCNEVEAYLRSPVQIGIISSLAGIIALFVCVLITWFLARLALRGKRYCNSKKLKTETEPVYNDIHESEMETSFTEDGFNKKDDPSNKKTQRSNSRLYYESSIYDIPIERDSTTLDDTAVRPSFDYSTSGIYGSPFERVSIGLENTDVGPSSDCTSRQSLVVTIHKTKLKCDNSNGCYETPLSAMHMDTEDRANDDNISSGNEDLYAFNVFKNSIENPEISKNIVFGDAEINTTDTKNPRGNCEGTGSDKNIPNINKRSKNAASLIDQDLREMKMQEATNLTTERISCNYLHPIS